MPSVSIITPSHGRPTLLERQHSIVAAQTVDDFEWLILDDSPQPCAYFATLDDPRVRYHHHAGEKMLVSIKRNWLCERATAPVIAQFDDDDYYAPHYLATMLERLEREGTDLVKLSGWFVYSALLRRLGWWDTTNLLGLHFTFGADPVLRGFFNQTAPENMRSNWFGFGFSYVFRKSMWERQPFPPVAYASDSGFVGAAMAKGSRLAHFADTEGLCLHILRMDNMSRSFPQYLLPDFMLERLFSPAVRPLLE
jgi:glycosyltransferase involved in cell wall biosynthesis